VSHSFDNRRRRHETILFMIVVICLRLVACGPSRDAKQADPKATTQAKDTDVKRYPLTGRVVSVDKPTQSMNVDGDAIPGFMAAMTMSYQVKDASVLDKLSPGDQIKAEIVVANDGAYLENVVLAQKAAAPNPAK
jgi:Cu/Ag efflux protein CusF